MKHVRPAFRSLTLLLLLIGVLATGLGVLPMIIDMSSGLANRSIGK